MENLNILNHVAIILDGNRRWAKQNGKTSLEGHKAGLENLIKLAKHALNSNIEVLSVFAFSTENFKRSEKEVNHLMNLFINMFNKYAKDLNKENIKVVFSGSTNRLRKDLIESINNLSSLTKNNTKGIFNICLNYGSHMEIIDSIKNITNDVINKKLDINKLDDEIFNNYLYQNLPPIDLFIRTGGDYRISNFMLWQLAYSELYFTKTYFPDFNEEEFDKAILEFNNRERRFGGDTNEN